MTSSKIVVVGSGPAGTAASWPLVEAGHDVQMLDAGIAALPSTPINRPTLAELRGGAPDAWRHLLKPDLSGLREVGDTSPKLRCAANAEFEKGYQESNQLFTSDYVAVGALAQGGLSNVWGAVTPVFDEADLTNFPFGLDALLPSYRAVADRIGISCGHDDPIVNGPDIPTQPPLPLAGVGAEVFERYRALEEGLSVRIARSRLAVLSEDKGARRGCDQGGGCLWGCPHSAVFNSAEEIAQLEQYPNFSFVSGKLVRSLTRKDGGGFSIQGVDRQAKSFFEHQSETVILAAGTLPSTRLVLSLLEKYGEPLPLATTPGFAAAYCLPSHLLRPLPELQTGVPQLTFRLGMEEGENAYAFGLMFNASTMSLPDLVAHLPLTRRGGTALMEALLPSLALVLCNLPSEYADCQISLERGEKRAADRLNVSGKYLSNFVTAAKNVRAGIARDFSRLGLYSLPGSAHLYPPGALNHHAGTLPMGGMTSKFGEVEGAPDLFVVDGSVLNGLPARNHTFTVMANADRIGRYLAARSAH